RGDLEMVAEEVVAEGPAVEHERQVERPGQLALDALQRLVGEALGLQGGAGDVRAAVEGAGPAAVADDLLDLLLGVAEAAQGRGQRGVDDLEVAAAGEL